MSVLPRFLAVLALCGAWLSAVPPVCAATAGDHVRRIAVYSYMSSMPVVGLSPETVTALKDDGTLLEWGRAPYDALNGPPRRIGRMGRDARSVSAGVWGVAVVKTDGTVAMRSHDANESFKTVVGLDNVVDVKVGRSSALALKADGTVWSWGFYTGNDGCVLGDRPDMIENLGYCMFPKNTLLSPAPVPGATNVAEIDMVGAGTAAFYRKHDGSVWINGTDYLGTYSGGLYIQPFEHPRLMQVPGLNGIVSISAFRHTHVVALKADGTVWMWGTSDTAGNDPGSTDRYVSTSAIQIPGLAGIVKIANGRHILALREDGALFQFGCWGSGCPRSPAPDTSPNAAPFDPTPDAVPVRVTALGNLDAASVVEMYSLYGGGKIIVKNDGTVLAWGSGAGAGMGVCNFGGAQFGTGLEAARAVQDHDCLAPLNLGSGDPVELPQSVRPSVAVTHLYLAAIDASGRVWITNEAGTGTPVPLWDVSGFGYLNLADGGSARPDILFAYLSPWQSSPPYLVVLTQSGKVYQCEASVARGMCLRMEKILDGVASIGGGASHVGAVKRDGGLWGWGSGAGDTTPITQHLGYDQSGIPSSRTYYGTPRQVAGLGNVAAVAKSQGAALALKQDGTVWLWGASPAATQQIQIDGAVAAAGGAGAYYVLRNDGSVWAWGRNIFGELGTGQSSYTSAASWSTMAPARVAGLDAVAAIAAGDTVAATIRGDGSLWSFGANYGGVLGIGATGGLTDIFAPTRGRLDALAVIAGGPNSMAAITRDGKVWVWGKNIVAPAPVKGSDGNQMDLAAATLPLPAAAASGGQTTLSLASIECLLAWAETAYPQELAPAGSTTRTAAPYTYRHYAGSGAYLGVSGEDGHLYYLGPVSGGAFFDLGLAASWRERAGCP